MNGVVNGYYLETGYGFDVNNSTVTTIDHINEFNQIICGEMVFRGTWNECVKYANTH